LPQALTDFWPRGRASFRIEVSDHSPIGTESLLHHCKRFGSWRQPQRRPYDSGFHVRQPAVGEQTFKNTWTA
jgi:hypothetical protein